MAQTRQGRQPGRAKRGQSSRKVPPARSARDSSVPGRRSGEIAALQALGSGIFRSVLEFELALFGHALKCFAGIFDPVLIVIAIRRQQPHHLVRPARARARDGARRKQYGLTDPKLVRAQDRRTRLKVVRDRRHGSDRNRRVRLGFCRNLPRNSLTHDGIAADGPPFHRRFIHGTALYHSMYTWSKNIVRPPRKCHDLSVARLPWLKRLRINGLARAIEPGLAGRLRLGAARRPFHPPANK